MVKTNQSAKFHFVRQSQRLGCKNISRSILKYQFLSDKDNFGKFKLLKFHKFKELFGHLKIPFPKVPKNQSNISKSILSNIPLKEKNSIS